MTFNQHLRLDIVNQDKKIIMIQLILKELKLNKHTKDFPYIKKYFFLQASIDHKTKEQVYNIYCLYIHIPITYTLNNTVRNKAYLLIINHGN